jgi:hypothetical protein
MKIRIVQTQRVIVESLVLKKQFEYLLAGKIYFYKHLLSTPYMTFSFPPLYSTQRQYMVKHGSTGILFVILLLNTLLIAPLFYSRFRNVCNMMIAGQ